MKLRKSDKLVFSVMALSFLYSSPAMAASSDTFFSLTNTNFIVSIAFVLFLGVLVYYKAPQKIITLLDNRADQIRSEIDEARALKEEATELLVSYERKRKEIDGLAHEIILSAKAEAEAASAQAKLDIENMVKRRLEIAQDRIEAAETNAINEIKNKAISVAIDASAELISQEMSPAERAKSIEDSIKTVGDRLN